MEAINYAKIVAECIEAAKGELGKKWRSLEPYAEQEFKQFAENAADIARLKLEGKIDDKELKDRVEMQRLALKNVLLAIKGMGQLTAQNIINSVLQITSAAILDVLKIALL